MAVNREVIRPWEGGIITSWSGEFENLDGKGHGVKLEPLCMVVSTTYQIGEAKNKDYCHGARSKIGFR